MQSVILDGILNQRINCYKNIIETTGEPGIQYEVNSIVLMFTFLILITILWLCIIIFLFMGNTQ